MLAAYRERVRKQVEFAASVLAAYGFFLFVTGRESEAGAAADELVSTLRGTHQSNSETDAPDPIVFLLVGLNRTADLESILERRPPTPWKEGGATRRRRRPRWGGGRVRRSRLSPCRGVHTPPRRRAARGGGA
jgi:hypothetical protein